jgi:hypothetical protein
VNVEDFVNIWVIPVIRVGRNESMGYGGWLVFKILTERPAVDFLLKSCILGAALADSVDVVIEKPRMARRMAHRSTPGEIDATAMQYFKVNVFFPFIDHCLNDLAINILRCCVYPLFFFTEAIASVASLDATP